MEINEKKNTTARNGFIESFEPDYETIYRISKPLVELFNRKS